MDHMNQKDETVQKDFFKKSKRNRGRVKHEILRYYLGSYFGIWGQSKFTRTETCYYIDGFAGRGTYQIDDGTFEDGSPLVALKSAVEHVFHENFVKPIHMIFIDCESDIVEDLKKTLKDYMTQNPSKKVTYEVICGYFDEEMDQILDANETEPMLVFADPFGIKDIPMKLMKRLVNREKTELFVNVMFSSVTHWYNNPNYNKTFKVFLGEETNEWKTKVFKDDKSKAEAFVRYYVQKLVEPIDYTFDEDSDDFSETDFNHNRIFRKTNQIYSHIFAMKDTRNRNIYQLVFFTKFLPAVVHMKRAMVNCSQQDSTFVYSEWVEANLEPQKMSKSQIQEIVIKQIKEKFSGCGYVYGREIGRFVWLDTPFIFNLKNKLKIEFKELIQIYNRQFDKIMFQFP